MRLPFTTEAFFDVFRRYNEAVWPAQWALVALALVVLVAAHRERGAARRLAPAGLAALWLWMAVAYHARFFTAINPAAWGFAALFVVQALLLARAAARPTALAFAPGAHARGAVGWALVLYALVAYPLLGHRLGHHYPAAPTFGLPCPTTIFTLGVLAWAAPAPRHLLVVPVLWAIVATSAALQLGVREDLALPLAAACTVALAFAAAARPRAGARPQAAAGPGGS